MIWTYLIINVLTLAGPMARSFEPRIHFWRKWPHLFPALGLTLLFFIIWDSTFTSWGIWGFNPKYLVGLNLLNLPIEEWLFFITVPYACVFVYEVLNYFLRRDWLGQFAGYIAGALILGSLVVVWAFWGHAYTVSAFGLMAILLALHAFVFKSPWLGRFFVAYLVCLVPFLLVNGILTGAVTESPIVWYNDTENLGLRFVTIPMDDFAYGLDLILMNVGLFEWFRGRQR
jgi:lycopene cyclase domain-containing protein